MRFYAKNPDSSQKQTQTNPIQTHFYPRKTTPNPKQTQSNPIKRPLQPWVQRGDRPKRHKQMCQKYYLLSIYTGAQNILFVTLFLKIFSKFLKIPIICPKIHKKLSQLLFILLSPTDYLSFLSVTPAHRKGGFKTLFRKKLWTR